MDTLIRVDSVSKAFKLPHEKQSTVKSLFVSMFHGKRSYERQQVLKDVSFEIKKGEFFGIVGRNGSGKSTLLKLLAGIYSPDKGAIQVGGTLTPFIELGVGFNPELTGRENVYLNGALLGFSRKEVHGMYDEIVAFAELEKFMDQKLKNYSSGMQVRLAFSIAIRANTDILLIDEVLAVGDERFQNKCLNFFEKAKGLDKTIIFVSHDMESVKRFCDRAIVMHDAEKIFDGDTNGAVIEYVKKNFPEASAASQDENAGFSVKARELKGKSKPVFTSGQKVSFEVAWPKDDRIQNIGVALFNDKGHYVFGTNTIVDGVNIEGREVTYELELNLGSGKYYLQAGFFGKESTDVVHFLHRALDFSVVCADGWQGITHLTHKWK
jgi:ABC-2 type transport system ATP-binding protein